MAKKRAKRASKKSAARSSKRKARAVSTERGAQPKGMINAWEDDPGAGAQPSGGQVVQRPRAGKGTAETLRAAAPQTHETHTHELRREGKHMVLRRVRIDCGFAHH